MPVKDTIQSRRGSSAQWIAANPILADGEIGYDSTTKQIKIGDGTTAWNALAYSDISATNLTTGTLPDARLSAKVKSLADLATPASTQLLAMNSSGAVVDGSATLATATSKIPTFPKSRKCVLLGDSITDMCGGVRLNGTVQNNFMNGYFTAARWFLGQRFPSVINAGVSGDTTTLIAARIAAVTATNPDVVVVFCGINDCLTADVNNVSTVISTAQTNLTTIYDALTAAGAYIVAIPIWPVSKFVGGLDPGTYVRLAISRINSFIFKQTETRANFVVADIGAAFRNCNTNHEPFYSNDTTLDPAGYPGFLSDGIHPSASGAFAAGYLLANILDPIFPASSINWPGDETENYLPNADLRGAVDSPRSPPTSYTFNAFTGGASGTISYVNRDDGITGRWFRSTQVAGYGLAATCYKSPTWLNTGDVLIGEAEIRVVSGFVQPHLEIDARDLGATSFAAVRDGYTAGATVGGTDNSIETAVGWPQDRIFVLRTPPLTVPSGANQGFVQWTLNLVGTGTVDVGRVRLRKVT